MTESFADLAAITDAVYRGKMSSLQRLIAEESKLRQDLGKIDEIARANQGDWADTFQMQTLGADLLWDAWVTRQKIQLNSQLANVLVRKAGVVQDMQRAFGRARVADEIWENQKTLVRNARDNWLTEG